jgi:cell division septal protein FtsQ
MEIKTNRQRDTQSPRIIPPPDTGRSRKKSTQKLGKSHILGRRVLSALKVLGKLGAFLLMVVFMLSIFVYAYTSDKFNLRNITCYGCRELNPKQLEGIIRRDFPKNILRIDLHQLKSQLEKQTWAKEVEIRRVLPSDLIIYVYERTPSVILEIHNELMVTDSDGILLDRYDPRFGKLDVPVFRGVLGEDMDDYRLYQKENSARIIRALAMLAEIESESPQNTQKISEIDLSDPSNMKLMLVNDTAEIYLGDKDFQERFSTLMRFMGQYEELKSQNNKILSIDVRFNGQVVCRRDMQALPTTSRLIYK